MTVRTSITYGTARLTEIDRRRIARRLRSLERRLRHHPEPAVSLVLTAHAPQRQVEVSLRVQVGPLGSHLVSHQQAEVPGHAVRLAVEDVERQLERLHARQRGDDLQGRAPAAAPAEPPAEAADAGSGPTPATGDAGGGVATTG